jgi:flagella basal body P-ring formation protein FlgA
MTSAEVLQPALAWLNQSVAQAQAQTQSQTQTQTQTQNPSPWPIQMSVTVGQIDTRLQLAPCRQIEPSLPAGSRLWGKTRVALRCVDGVAKWQVFLPVQVKAVGPAWVVRRDVPAGATLSDDDLMMSEVDWAEDPSPVVTHPQIWATQVTARALTTGQTLRQNLLRPAQVFQAGSLVRVMAQGGGFQVSADGQALSAGILGQAVRVKMDNGRVMTGTVIDARTVKVDI